MTIVEDNFSNVTQSVLYEAIVYSLTLPLFIITAVGKYKTNDASDIYITFLTKFKLI